MRFSKSLKLETYSRFCQNAVLAIFSKLKLHKFKTNFLLKINPHSEIQNVFSKTEYI